MTDDADHPKIEHPELGPDDDATQRGKDPDHVVGTEPTRPPLADPDPGWQPDPGRAQDVRGLIAELGRERRPRREDVYPYLLVRATASGDRGKRPTWPPVPCWESPDILLIDAGYQGPFDPARLVLSPTAGRPYRVFVRVWNLGLTPAIGVHVKAWAINPGFFGVGNQNDPYYQQHLVGGAWTELTDRTRPGCVSVVELDRAWTPDQAAVGHHCVIAEVSCPLDPSGGMLLANTDRHVGQRNLEVLAGPAPLKAMLALLGGLVPEGATLELVHAGPAIRGALLAMGAGTAREPGGPAQKVVVPRLEEIRGGVRLSTGVHLLTAFREGGRTVVAASDHLARAAGVHPQGEPPRRRDEPRGRPGEGLPGRPGDRPPGRPQRHPLERPGGARRLLDELGPRRWDRVGRVTDGPLADALVDGVARQFDIADLVASSLAARLGGPAGAWHALRFTLTDREGALVGGFTVVVG